MITLGFLLIFLWLAILTWYVRDHTRHDDPSDDFISEERIVRRLEQNNKDVQRLIQRHTQLRNAIGAIRFDMDKEKKECLALYDAEGNMKMIPLTTIVREILKVEEITIPQNTMKSTTVHYSINSAIKPKYENTTK